MQNIKKLIEALDGIKLYGETIRPQYRGEKLVIACDAYAGVAFCVPQSIKEIAKQNGFTANFLDARTIIFY